MSILKDKITDLPIFSNENGSIMHVLKKSDSTFNGFGEAYISTINHNKIKGWKRHEKMTCNIVVPVGKVKFILYCQNSFEEYILSNEEYSRLTIPASTWFAFKGLSNTNLFLNIADIAHDDDEVETLPLINDLIPRIEL